MNNSRAGILKASLWQRIINEFCPVLLLCQFILLCAVHHARAQEGVIWPESQQAQLPPPVSEKLSAEETAGTEQQPPQSPNDLVLPQSPEDIERVPQQDKLPVSPQDVQEPPIFPEEEGTTAPDTCSQMLQFPFLENIIRLTRLSGELPHDFESLPRERAFEVMKEILLRRDFTNFVYWKNSRSVKQQWYLDFLYGVLEKDGLVESEASPEKRLEFLELGGYVSRIWSQEDCACYEDILNSFSDLIISDLLGKDRPKGPERPFPYYQESERELLEADLINIIITATGLSKRMYMSRQGISQENFCQVQRELLLRNGYTEFTPFDCVSYVTKQWYVDFLYNVLMKAADLVDTNDEQKRAEGLVGHGYLPQSAHYRQNILEEDIYMVINDPLFTEALHLKHGQEGSEENQSIPEFPDVYEELKGGEDESIPEFLDIYEEPISAVK